MSRPPARGLRREGPIVLVVALAIFAALAGFTLLAWRGAVERTTAEREAEALALAERLAREVARSPGGRIDPLLRQLPPGAALATFGSDGQLREQFGYGEPPEAEAPAAEPAGPRVVAPPESGRPAVIARVRFDSGAGSQLLRLDLPAAALAAERRALARLTPVVLGLTIAGALALLLYFRALARPYETMLARAREAGAGFAGPEGSHDELEALVGTFDRALAALAAGGRPLGGLETAIGGESGSGFVLLDREGRLLAATPAAAELLGIRPPPVGEPLASALAARPDLVALLAPAVASGEALPRGVLRGDRGEGMRAAVGVTAEPLRGEAGRPRGWLVVVADVTDFERRAASERLAEGLAQLGELSAGVAHELRNSLASLSGWLALARREALPAAAAECLEEAAGETAALARVVEDFLAFARPGTRRGERVDLAALLRHAAGDPGLAGVAVELALSPAGGEVVGDRGLLERALRNLLANAARAERDAGRSGPIEVALEPSGDGFEIRLDDRGPGLPAAVRERLFEPFASGQPGGAGLGLALARRIVLLHDGELAVGDRPGGGTRVHLWLPAGEIAT